MTTAKAFCRLAERLLRHPTAPYHEHGVREEVERICVEHGLACARDQFGNLLVRLEHSKTKRPLVLAAHLDHPGFEILRRLRANHWLARFNGGVPDRFFRRGTPIRLMPGMVSARLGNRRARQQREFEIRARGQATTGPGFAAASSSG